VNRIRPSVESAYSAARVASVSTQTQIGEKSGSTAPISANGSSTEPITYDWVYNPSINTRLMSFEAFGSGMDLDQPDYPYNATVYEERVGVEWHAQPQEELLAADEGM